MMIMITKADKMLYKLGFRLEVDNNLYIRYFNEEKYIYIWFDKLNKMLEIREDMDVSLLKALYAKLKELGWLNE